MYVKQCFPPLYTRACCSFNKDLDVISLPLTLDFGITSTHQCDEVVLLYPKLSLDLYSIRLKGSQCGHLEPCGEKGVHWEAQGTTPGWTLPEFPVWTQPPGGTAKGKGRKNSLAKLWWPPLWRIMRNDQLFSVTELLRQWYEIKLYVMLTVSMPQLYKKN